MMADMQGVFELFELSDVHTSGLNNLIEVCVSYFEELML
jgi:hypothetical protein